MFHLEKSEILWLIFDIDFAHNIVNILTGIKNIDFYTRCVTRVFFY